jgi:ketosteroid isomerase-like protein
MNQQFTEAFNAGDVDALLTLYEADAVLVPGPGAPAISGLAAIEAALRGLMATGIALELQGQHHCLVFGDLALLGPTSG